MNLRHLVRRHHHCITTPLRRLTHTSPTVNPNYNPNTPLISTQFNHTLPKSFRSSPPLSQSLSTAADVETDCDAPMNEFLSRFVHSMRSKLNEAYPNCDKHTIDSMLVVVVEKLVKEMEDSGGNFEGIGSKTGINESDNEDLTKTMWEVSNTVFREMETEKKKEKLKKYIQSEEVKELTQFAKNIGVRGDMLRELRFKWAREAMEDAEFYTDLMELKKQELELEMDNAGDGENNVVEGGERERELLPKRRGKINYKLYGLDLSGEKWREVADKIHEVEEVVWPSEAKSITGKCKLVTEKIVGLGIDRVEGEGEEMIKEWVESLQPTRVDWVALLGNVKARCYSVYLKV